MLRQLNDLFVTPVYAACDPSQGGLNLKDCLLLNQEGQTVADVYSDPSTLVNIVIRNLFVLAGVFLFFMIIWAGFKFVMNPGNKGIEEAKEIMKAVVMGIVIMFAAYWIMQIIEVITGIDNLI